MSGKKNDLGEVVIYRTRDSKTALDVRLVGETVWLTQAQIADLFKVNVPAVSKHIKNIYEVRELVPKATISKTEIVRVEGKRRVSRKVDLYNLDMIISVGYRVNSAQATRFRIWATQTLKDHLVRGYNSEPGGLSSWYQTMGRWRMRGCADWRADCLASPGHR